MALPIGQQFRYWGIAAAVAMIALWFLGDVILPFIVGGAIAYGLDPLADRLERWGASRVVATSIISVFAILIFVLMAVLIVPMIVNEAVELFESAPELFARLRDFLSERFPELGDAESTLRQSLASIGKTIQERGGEFAKGVFSSALGVINAVVFIVVVPVVAFYMLLDWDNLIAKIDTLLPRDHAPRIRQIAKDIDTTLASFVRGQLTVCTILGVFYAVGLMLVGLQFGLVIGFIAGLISFIPYIGAVVGGVLAVGLALFQFWGEPWMIGAVAAVFAAGQFLEGNILTPKLVGESVGLHPVWLMFALSVFGSLFGFVGMLVAVPVAAALGVLARFGTEQYRKSLLYRGLDRDDVAEGPE
ncbi:AI-2E family transporter [Litoreibacter arenae]|uniref:Permease often clustered with de novo purine synthesis n=1 Tax=Litoreibacter arenae DSM 19593 TaxID=1123360 RepID=S9S0U4_9RHOB|nr:AI-2E family transporter [Litoreibacter arenae]EPX79859.1 Putative permease often clustered with de novo purine synthesis [Litoreibacter arenae DSM 19593]